MFLRSVRGDTREMDNRQEEMYRSEQLAGRDIGEQGSDVNR
jgi:hypothetical protein